MQLIATIYNIESFRDGTFDLVFEGVRHTLCLCGHNLVQVHLLLST